MLSRERWTMKATKDLFELDETYIGTRHYLGLAYFWSHEYRHSLRDASPYYRKLVHDKILEAGLELSGVSYEHDKILKKNII